MLAGRIVSRVPDQAAIPVGRALAILQLRGITRVFFARVGVAEQSEGPEVLQSVEAKRQFERGDVRLISRGDATQSQHLVEARRGTATSLVAQSLAEETPLNFGILYFERLAFGVNCRQKADSIPVSFFILPVSLFSLAVPLFPLLHFGPSLLQAQILRFVIR